VDALGAQSDRFRRNGVMLRKLVIAAAWSCLAFIIYATLSPIDARPVIAGGYFTILERFGAYAVLGFLFHWAYPRI
jgi:hypothetical protein